MTDTRLAPRELPGDEYAWGVQVALAFDCLLNALVKGWHHETLSSRAWRAFKNGKDFGLFFKPKIDWIFGLLRNDPNHCERHHLEEVARAQKIVDARKYR